MLKTVSDFELEYTKAKKSNKDKFKIDCYTLNIKRAEKLIELIQKQKISPKEYIGTFLSREQRLKQFQEDDRLRFRKERAKSIAKILRKNNIRTGVIKGNGTTSPIGTDKFTAYFAMESYDKSSTLLYLDFNIDGKTGNQIEKLLKENDIEFVWDGKESSTFQFAVDYSDLEKTWDIVL